MNNKVYDGAGAHDVEAIILLLTIPLLDLVAMIVFMIAFAFKNLSSCPDESRYQLTHFT